MNSIKLFNSEPFINALEAFFLELKVPVIFEVMQGRNFEKLIDAEKEQVIEAGSKIKSRKIV